ncbi:hypothetical protein A2U01_0068710, partial [Trifolium medium]|nr:hypothetical protein [Trifolium medium]
MYDPIAKKIIVSRDVIFEESKAWNWNNENAIKNSEQVTDYEDNNDVEVEIEQNDADIDDNVNHANDNVNQNNDTNTSDMDLEDDSDETEHVTTPRERRPPGYLR